MTNLRAGAQLYSVRDLTQNPIDMDDAFRRIADMGFSLVETAGHASFITPTQLRDCAQRNGLTVDSEHVSFEKIRSDIDSVIQNQRILGCKYLGINKMPEYYRRSREGILAFAKDASLCARKLADAGFVLTYHHMLFDFRRVDGVTPFQLLLENTPDEFMFELDTYWLQIGGHNPADAIRKLKGRAPLVLFKDVVGTLGNTPDMAPFGEGNLEWRSIIAACEEAGVHRVYVEQDNAVDFDSMECLRTSADNLRKYGVRM